jgi:hypothetical protein
MQVTRIDYALTTQNDPVKPGRSLKPPCNLSDSTQHVILDFTVPEFTTYGAYPPGSSLFVSANVIAGTSYTFRLLFDVAGGNTAPPDGTVITLRLTDNARGVMLPPRSAVVQRTPPLNLQLSTEQGTVAPGGTPHVDLRKYQRHCA